MIDKYTKIISIIKMFITFTLQTDLFKNEKFNKEIEGRTLYFTKFDNFYLINISITKNYDIIPNIREILCKIYIKLKEYGKVNYIIPVNEKPKYENILLKVILLDNGIKN